MKKLKKLVIFTIVLCLIFSSINIYGFEEKTINGTGKIEYVDTKTPIFTVTLPTVSNYNFTIDIDGFLSMDTKTVVKVEDLKEKGKIVFENNEAFSYIKNKSSVPILIQMDFKITDDNTGDEVEVISEQNDGKYFTGNTNQIVLGVVPCSNEINNLIDSDANNFPSSEKIVPISTLVSIPTTFGFYLEPAIYIVKREGTKGSYNYKYEIDNISKNNFDATGFKLAGRVNPDANWSDYTGENPKKIGISIVYKILDASQVDDVGSESIATTKYVTGMDSLLSKLNETIPIGGTSKLGGLELTDYEKGIKIPIEISDLFANSIIPDITLNIPDSTMISKKTRELILNSGSGDLGLKDQDKINLSKIEIRNPIDREFYDVINKDTITIKDGVLTIILDAIYMEYYPTTESTDIKITYINGNSEEKVLEGTIQIVE